MIAKRSVVSAANYAERSSFAKDQIFVLLPIEVISHANEVFLFFCIQPIFFLHTTYFCQQLSAYCCLAVIMEWFSYMDFIQFSQNLLCFITIYCLLLIGLVRRTVMSDINHIEARCCRCSLVEKFEWRY